MKEWLEKRTTNFYDTLKKLKLHSSYTMLNKKSVKVDISKVVLKADRGLFARMIAIAQTRLLNL